MSKKCKKKSTTMTAAQRKLAEVKTLTNKRDRLIRQVRQNPTDLSAKNALMQVMYDIRRV
ncbi:MAG: hypothetical protein GWN62_11775 [Aliifodinibius sp.]|nr:hypothetical protein [Fodinibius sp.]